MVLLHYRVVPGLGATPPQTPAPSPRTEQPAVPVSNPITLTDPTPDTQAAIDEPCDCHGVPVAISVAA